MTGTATKRLDGFVPPTSAYSLSMKGFVYTIVRSPESLRMGSRSSQHEEKHWSLLLWTAILSTSAPPRIRTCSQQPSRLFSTMFHYERRYVPVLADLPKTGSAGIVPRIG